MSIASVSVNTSAASGNQTAITSGAKFGKVKLTGAGSSATPPLLWVALAVVGLGAAYFYFRKK